MATTQVTRKFVLTPHFDRFVQQKVDSGRYQSASEVVRESLHLLEEREEARRQLRTGARREIEVGWEQSERGEVVDGPAVFAEIRKMSKARAHRREGQALRKPAYELTTAARLDLLQVWNYLAEQASIGVADKVVADLEAGIRKVAQTPALGHRRADSPTAI